MAINTQKLRSIGALLDGQAGRMKDARIHAIFIRAAAEEIDRLQRVIDSRPAINAGLPETYINWSQSIYAMEAAQAQETKQ